MEYYSDIKEILPFVTTWMDHKSNMLTEISHKEKQILYDFYFLWTLKKKNPSSLIQGPDWWLPEIQGWRLDKTGEGGQKVKKKSKFPSLFTYIKRKAMASLVAWTVKRLPTMRETQVWSLGLEGPWRRKWQPTPVFMPGKSHGLRSLVGYSPWNCKESHMTQQIHFTSLHG